ncbi:hypothetical protein OG689_01040 [Kitasatospora sp. NBC_00240]|uniref:hypothetical protein n=1 Tax=Kitasatospora sp. NBC_00240 TaxID=2903567 RepID=UPI00225A6AB7|nr:hypothetical protein [Kitasatospora sp. NBC_00240]MCX5207918.1 hypothetical protein [Kitasatospora sp. NBC_00240]
MKTRFSKLRLVAAGLGIAMALGSAAGTAGVFGGTHDRVVVAAPDAGLEDWNSTGS